MMGTRVIPVEESAGAGRASSRGGGRRPPRRRVVECPNRTPAIGTAMASVSMNFGPQNCGAVPRTSVQDQGAARMIEDYYNFQWVLIFEQSVNHRRGPRSWPQTNWSGCDVAFGRPKTRQCRSSAASPGSGCENRDPRLLFGECIISAAMLWLLGWIRYARAHVQHLAHDGRGWRRARAPARRDRRNCDGR